ncbi:MAG: hypothetical protein F6K44_00835 [Moorea sp. SIO3E2]|nr:hypothetical protein [Moorena sp. SIO3E2]
MANNPVWSCLNSLSPSSQGNVRSMLITIASILTQGQCDLEHQLLVVSILRMLAPSACCQFPPSATPSRFEDFRGELLSVNQVFYLSFLVRELPLNTKDT